MHKIIINAFILISIAITTTAVYHKTQKANMNYYPGHRYLKKGDREKALILLGKALSIDKNHLGALKDLSELYTWLHKFDKAIEMYEDILRLKPKDRKAKYSLAKVYTWSKNYPRAVALYSELIQATNDKQFKKDLAEIYIWDNQLDKAKGLLDEVLKESPSDYEARFLLAKTLQYLKQPDEAIKIYNQLLDEQDRKYEPAIMQLMAESYTVKAEFTKSEEKYREIIEYQPENLDAIIKLADVLSWKGQYEQALEYYRQALKIEPDNIKVQKKIADVLSWDNRFKEALAIYDKLLSKGENAELRLQRARILGWAAKYELSMKEYQKVLKTDYTKTVDLEMKAKRAYWSNHILHAIKYYNQLIEVATDNLEAMFDLSQIYSHHSMWKDALYMYDKILYSSPSHLKAQAGLKKAELASKHICLNSGYEYFEADSLSRDSDIKKYTFFNEVNVPVSYNAKIGLYYALSERKFSDFGDTTENKGRIDFFYQHRPYWWADILYNFIEYSKDIETMHEYAGIFASKIFDIGESKLSYQRERLENTSTVIRNKYYRDNYKARMDIDLDSRIKLGADYLWSYYSDSNFNNEPGVDIKYYASYEPRALYVKYRYFFRNFDKTAKEYFSPEDFSSHTVTFNWRHYINKETGFFGADDIYYEAGYDVSVDSEDIVGHKFTGGICYNVNKNLEIKTEAQYAHSSANVYEDKRLQASVKFYF